MLTASASLKNAQAIKQILDQFYSLSSLKSSFEKSKICFLLNTDVQLQQAISSYLNFDKT